MKWFVCGLVCVLALALAGFEFGQASKSDAKRIELKAERDKLAVELAALRSTDAAAFIAVEKERDGAMILNRELWEKSESLARQLEKLQASQRVDSLPQDAADWHVSLFVQDDWQNRPCEKRAVAMFSKPGTWAHSLKGKMQLHVPTKVGEAGADRFFGNIPGTNEKIIPGTPCLVIQNDKGQIVYRETNPDLSKRPRKLSNQIETAMRRQRHRNECPNGICPQPDQKKSDVPKPIDEVVADQEKEKADVKPEKTGVPAALAVLIFFGVFVLGLIGAIFVTRANVTGARIIRGLNGG